MDLDIDWNIFVLTTFDFTELLHCKYDLFSIWCCLHKQRGITLVLYFLK